MATKDTKPLRGLGVLVTRPADQATDLVARIEASGGRAIVHPVIAILPPYDEDALDDAAYHLESYDWVIFTSVNAVEALLQRVPGVSRPRSVACVGTATARAIEARGLNVDLIPSEFSSEALMSALIEHLGPRLKSCRFLLPRAAEGRETLPHGLRARGAHVDVVTAYRTVPCTQDRETLVAAFSAGHINVLTFASPSAVESFDRLLASDRTALRVEQLPAICIGPTTAARARALGYSAILAARANTDGLIEAIGAVVSPG